MSLAQALLDDLDEPESVHTGAEKWTHRVDYVVLADRTFDCKSSNRALQCVKQEPIAIATSGDRTCPEGEIPMPGVIGYWRYIREESRTDCGQT